MRRQATRCHRYVGAFFVLIGSPGIDRDRVAGAQTMRAGAAPAGRALPALFPIVMPKQPSFGERVKAMQAVANNLLATASLLSTYAEEIGDEADRMAAAAKRFSERRADKRE